MDKKSNAKSDYVSKRLIYNGVSKELNTCRVLKSIDRFDYEANCWGCEVKDYDKYRRKQLEEYMLLFGALGIYFLFGMLLGVVAIISWAYQF